MKYPWLTRKLIEIDFLVNNIFVSTRLIPVEIEQVRQDRLLVSHIEREFLNAADGSYPFEFEQGRAGAQTHPIAFVIQMHCHLCIDGDPRGR